MINTWPFLEKTNLIDLTNQNRTLMQINDILSITSTYPGGGNLTETSTLSDFTRNEGDGARGISPVHVPSSPSDQRSSTSHQDRRNRARQANAQIVTNARRIFIQEQLVMVSFWYSLFISIAQMTLITAVLIYDWGSKHVGLAHVYFFMLNSWLFIHLVQLFYHRLSIHSLVNNEHNAYVNDPLVLSLPNFMLALKRFTEISYLTLWAVGLVAYFSMPKHFMFQKSSTYGLLILLISYQTIAILSPTLFLLLFIFCLPCLVVAITLIFPANSLNGARKEAIEQLESVLYSSNGICSESIQISDDEATCSICIDEYAERVRIRILPCRHHFHQACVDQWLLLHNTCPLCIRTVCAHDRTASNSSSTTPDYERQLLNNTASPINTHSILIVPREDGH